MKSLSPKRRSELRAQAHALSPIVLIGDKGLTDEVVTEIDRSLKAHELIKVRAATDDRDARGQWLEAICERLQAHPVQQIGKVFVLFRENPEAREKAEGERRPAAGREVNRRRTASEVVSDRGKLRQRSRDADKQRAKDVKDMIRKGKIKPKEDVRSATAAPPEDAATGTSRPRSRTPSPRPESAPPRRRPRTSR